MIAPEEQKHIPAIFWMSDDFKNEFNLNTQCLKNVANTEISHDYIFHSMLGLLNIKTDLYNKNLDIFANCRTK